jgi:hypothetical protein
MQTKTYNLTFVDNGVYPHIKLKPNLGLYIHKSKA